MNDDSSDVDQVEERTRIEQACDYGRAGLLIFPTHGESKRPMPGYLWDRRATNRVNHIVEDFTQAIEMWGEDNVGIGWALGLDGHMAVDLDQPNPPEWWDAIDYAAVPNVTARGVHLIYREPGFEPSNSTSQFPTQGWGDMRGHGGYIVIAGPDRPGFDVSLLASAQVFPRPDWLLPYGHDTSEGPVAVSAKGVIEFAEAHNTASDKSHERSKLSGLATMIDNFMHDWQGGAGGRHDKCLGWLTKAAEESAAGYYPFKAALVMIRDWWIDVMKDEPQRAGREFEDMCRWAVGKATSKAALPTVETTSDEPVESLVDSIALLDPTFHPVDLASVLDGTFIPPTPSILRRDDDRMALLYRGQINGIHADSGTGKGWVALFAAAQQLRGGNSVMMLDLEDVPSSIVDRLRKMHVSDEAIRERFIYIRPSADFDATAVEHLVSIVEARHPTLVIIDSLGEAFGLEGIDENHDSEVGPWLRRVPRRLADTSNGEEGPAVLIVDHVTKAGENPLHPSGSKRKRAAVGGASYFMQAVVPLNAATGGRLRLICAKDRHGNFARNETVADLVIKVDPIISTWEATLWSPASRDDSPTGRISRAANKVVEALAGIGKPTSANVLYFGMGGNKADFVAAIEAGIDSGQLTDERIGNRRVISLTDWTNP